MSLLGAARAVLVQAAGVLAAAALAGCAALNAPAMTGQAAQASATAGPSAAATAPAAAASAPAAPPRVEVQAPPPLRELLLQHLDLVRLGRLAEQQQLDAVSETEWSRLIAATPAQAQELAQTEGWFNAKVEVSVIARQPLRLRVQVQAGTRTTVAGVHLHPQGDLATSVQAGQGEALALLSAAQQAWGLPAGAVFRNADWADAKAAVLTRLRAAGYAAAGYLRTAADVDPATHTATLTLVLDSGPLFRTGALDIRGLKHHDEATVRHLAGFAPGIPATEALLLDYQERLQKTGLFDQATVTLDPQVQQAAQARIQVRLQERVLQQLTTGIGYSANHGLRASVEHLHRRPFGWAAVASNKLEWAAQRQAWEGELSGHPGPGMARNLLGAALERLVSDTDTVLSQRARVGRTWDTLALERLAFVELERALQRTASTRHQGQALSANLHTVWRNLDSVLLPTRGYSLALQGALGHSSSSTDAAGGYGRLYGRLTGYWPLGRSWYGQARLELGQVLAREGLYVPETQRFRAGGDNSVRGYTYRSLGPLRVDGTVGSGNSLATASLELAHPLSAKLPSLWGAVFVDAGDAAAKLAQLRPALGYGAGVRWRSPVGPLKLDLAWGQRTGKARVHFSVGIAY